MSSSTNAQPAERGSDSTMPPTAPIYARSKTKPSCPHHGAPLIYTHGMYGGYYACPHCPDDCDVTANKSEFDAHFYMTDQATRDARKAAHAAFDTLWKPRGEATMPRNKAYRWLAEAMGVEMRACHVQHFDVAACARVVELVAGRKAGDAGAGRKEAAV